MTSNGREKKKRNWSDENYNQL